MKTGVYEKAGDLLLLWVILLFSSASFRGILSSSDEVMIVTLDTIEIVSYKPQEVVNNAISDGVLQPGEDAHEKMIIMLDSIGVKYPKVVWHQIILETGWLKSRVYKENNNPFGMKRNLRGYALNPKGKAKPKKCDCFDWDLHACYPSKYEAIQDFIAWQTMILENYKEVYGRLPKNDGEYISMLNALPIKAESGRMGFYPYASAGHYTKSLKRLMSFTEANPLLAQGKQPEAYQKAGRFLLAILPS